MTYKVTSRQKMLLERFEKYHLFDSLYLDWNERATEPFPKGQAGPNETIWIKKEENYEPYKISQAVGINHFKINYWRFRRQKARKLDLIIHKEWEQNYPFVWKVLTGDQEAWREAVRRYAVFYKKQEVATAFSLHLFNKDTVECDVFLHEINEIIPNQIEKVTPKGYKRYFPMQKTQRLTLYEKYIYSCLARIVQDLFAVLPCKVIYINGILGSRYDHTPIISLVVERTTFNKRNDPKKIFKDNRCLVEFKKRIGFNSINRVYSPTVLLKRG
jgi:hypothetical protein